MNVKAMLRRGLALQHLGKNQQVCCQSYYFLITYGVCKKNSIHEGRKATISDECDAAVRAKSGQISHELKSLLLAVSRVQFPIEML